MRFHTIAFAVALGLAASSSTLAQSSAPIKIGFMLP